jgi:SMI1 / KNR4 family protein
MLISELKRIYSLFDERGRKIDEDLYTTPIKR